MKNNSKKIISLIIVFAIAISVCVVPAFASTYWDGVWFVEQLGNDDMPSALQAVSSHWYGTTTYSAVTVVSGDDLSSLCLELSSSGFPCSIVGPYGSNNYYYIQGTGSCRNPTSGEVLHYGATSNFNIASKYFGSNYSYIVSHERPSSVQLVTVTSLLNSIYAACHNLDLTADWFKSTNSWFADISNSLIRLQSETGWLHDIYSKIDGTEFSLDLLNSNVQNGCSSIVAKLDSLATGTVTNIDNITTNITNENSAYNVFYVTDSDGNEKPVADVAGDSLTASGKLLNFLYKFCFEGALSDVDNSVGHLTDFYFDSSPGLGEGLSIWD